MYVVPKYISNVHTVLDAHNCMLHYIKPIAVCKEIPI